VILSITVTACAGVKSTNVVCPHNGTYDLCIFVIFSETSFVDVCAANHRFPQITFEALRTGCPPYLTDFLQHHQPTRSSHLSLLLFRNITYRLDPVLSALQPHVSGTPCLSILANPSRFLLLNVIWILISVLQIIALVNYHTFIWKIIWWRRKRWSERIETMPVPQVSSKWCLRWVCLYPLLLSTCMTQLAELFDLKPISGHLALT